MTREKVCEITVFKEGSELVLEGGLNSKAAAPVDIMSVVLVGMISNFVGNEANPDKDSRLYHCAYLTWAVQMQTMNGLSYKVLGPATEETSQKVRAIVSQAVADCIEGRSAVSQN